MNKKRTALIASVAAIIIAGAAGYVGYNQPVSAPNQMVQLDLSKDENRHYLSEANYATEMTDVVELYLTSIESKNYFTSKDGKQIHYKQYIMPDAKGHIVISHGLTETAEKYKEVIYYFVKEGYSVHIPEHRSHGMSERLVEDLSMVHVEDFNTFVVDFESFVTEMVLPQSEDLPLFLFAHSMGGGIGSIFLERYPEYFDAAILSAPMMEINLGKYPELVARVITNAMVLLGSDEKYIFGDEPFTGEHNFEGSSSGSMECYNYYFEKRVADEYLQTNGSSFGWLKESLEATDELVKKKNASKAITLTVLFQAELDHLVMPEGHYKYAQYAPNTSLIFVPGTKHEIFNATNEIMVPYFNTIFDFFDSVSESL